MLRIGRTDTKQIAIRIDINTPGKRLRDRCFKAALYFLVSAAGVVNHSLCKVKGGEETTLLRYGFKGK